MPKACLHIKSKYYFYKVYALILKRIIIKTYFYYAKKDLYDQCLVFVENLFWSWKLILYWFKMICWFLENFRDWFESNWNSKPKVMKRSKETENRKRIRRKEGKIYKGALRNYSGPAQDLACGPASKIPNRYPASLSPSLTVDPTCRATSSSSTSLRKFLPETPQSSPHQFARFVPSINSPLRL
jgi:hypothetical protein